MQKSIFIKNCRSQFLNDYHENAFVVTVITALRLCVLRVFACCVSELELEAKQTCWHDTFVLTNRYCFKVDVYSTNLQSDVVGREESF